MSEIKKMRDIISQWVLATVMACYFFILCLQVRTFAYEQKILFLTTYIIVCCGLVVEKSTVSLYKMHMYFILLFMILAPISQLNTRYYPWGQIISNDEINKACFVVLLYSFIYIISYLFYQNRLRMYSTLLLKTFPNENKFYTSLIILSTICFIGGLFLIGPTNLFYRVESDQITSSFSFLLSFIFTSVPVISSGIFISALRKKIVPKSYKYKLFLVLSLLYTVVLNFPARLSRYMTAAVYLGLIICWIPPSKWTKRFFDLIILVGVFIIFPFLSLFKRLNVIQVTQNINMIKIGDFNTVDFDAFSMLAHTVRFIEDNGVQWGRQLRNALVFFIPRSIIDVKGTPSGTLIAEVQGFYYTNLSEPIMAEGLIDFGIVGVIIFAIVMAYISARIDYFSMLDKMFNKITYSSIIFAFSIGFIFFVSRGSLQATTIRVMGFFLPVIVIYIISKFRLRSELD